MIKYILKKNNVEGSHSFGKWYAFPVKESTVDIDKLAEHMAAHNTPYSAGAIKGIITDMVSCIKELLLEGRSVKLPDLAIFSIGIKNTRGGAVKEEEFTVAANIDGLKLRARATCSLQMKDLETSLRRATVVEAKKKQPVTPPKE